MIKLQIGLVCLFSLWLTNCGFHLRGFVAMPPWLNHVAIINQSDSRDLTPILSDQLQAYDIQVSSDPLSAKYRLIILNDAFQQQMTSVSSTTTPRQYQLIYTIWFNLQDATGQEIIRSSQVFVTRQITINSDRMLGSDFEEALTKREMRRDAVMKILNRLSRYEGRR